MTDRSVDTIDLRRPNLLRTVVLRALALLLLPPSEVGDGFRIDSLPVRTSKVALLIGDCGGDVLDLHGYRLTILTRAVRTAADEGIWETRELSSTAAGLLVNLERLASNRPERVDVATQSALARERFRTVLRRLGSDNEPSDDDGER